VFAPTLTGAEARAFRACIGDHPLVLWDNFPVNDIFLSNNLHLGPLTGRDADLASALRGHLLNPMTQAHASLVALGTAAAYFRDPQGYEPETAWQATLAELDPSGGLAILAAQTRSSPLDLDDAHVLAAAVDRVAASHAASSWQGDVETLLAEITHQRGAPATIAAHLGGTPLGDEIAPWVAELDAHTSSAADAVRFLRAMKPDLLQVTATISNGMLHVTGRAVGPDAATLATLAPRFSTVPPLPSFGDLLTCKGNDLLTAEIPLCPELGLNVHGKALYVVPYTTTDIRTITGRNMHRRLLELVAARYADFIARHGAQALPLTVTLDGQPLVLSVDGTFDATIPAPPGAVVLQVMTAAGDATSRGVP
jgi:hypothetical protein